MWGCPLGEGWSQKGAAVVLPRECLAGPRQGTFSALGHTPVGGSRAGARSGGGGGAWGGTGSLAGRVGSSGLRTGGGVLGVVGGGGVGAPPLVVGRRVSVRRLGVRGQTPAFEIRHAGRDCGGHGRRKRLSQRHARERSCRRQSSQDRDCRRRTLTSKSAQSSRLRRWKPRASITTAQMTIYSR